MTDLERIPEPDEYDDEWEEYESSAEMCEHGKLASEPCDDCENEGQRMDAARSAYYGGLGPLT
jgi:hypothetical protein